MSERNKHIGNERPGTEKIGAACPSNEMLLAYVDGTLGDSEDFDVRLHLAYCTVCPDLVGALIRLNASEGHEGSSPMASPLTWAQFSKRIEEPPQRTVWLTLRQVAEWLRGPMPAAIGALAAITLLVLGLDFYPSELSRLAYVDKERASVSEERSSGAQANLLGDQYRQGLRLLGESQFWIFNRVNQTKLDESIRALERARQLAQADGKEGYLARCGFYLGKAYLKKKDVVQARRQFEAFRNLPGASALPGEYDEAGRILHALNRLESSHK